MEIYKIHIFFGRNKIWAGKIRINHPNPSLKRRGYLKKIPRLFKTGVRGRLTLNLPRYANRFNNKTARQRAVLFYEVEKSSVKKYVLTDNLYYWLFAVVLSKASFVSGISQRSNDSDNMLSIHHHPLSAFIAKPRTIIPAI